MAKRFVSSKNQVALQNLSSKRKRALVDEDAYGDGQWNKKQRPVPENNNDDDDENENDDASLNSDMELSSADGENEEGIEEIDDEPEQGTVLWSEDQEEYPQCAVYHEDVEQHQSRITDLVVNVTEQLSEICHKDGDMAKFHTEAMVIQKFPELKKIVIALMGEAGSGMTCMQNDFEHADCTTGKSSLINSILDIPHIAKEVSVSCVPLEICMLIELLRATMAAHALAP